jgi:hypothetical protein
MNLESQINRIGNKMIACRQRCPGIVLELKEGILPRCLVLENGQRKERGVVIVGINPAESNSKERNYYADNRQTYKSAVKYWQDHISKGYHKHYTPLRRILKVLGFDGPTLWTELVKCENATAHKGMPLDQTFDTCIELYLREELSSVPNDWSLIAIGKKAYKQLASRFPECTIIGVPHPAYGHLERALKSKKQWLPTVKEHIKGVRSEKWNKSVWILNLVSGKSYDP